MKILLNIEGATSEWQLQNAISIGNYKRNEYCVDEFVNSVKHTIHLLRFIAFVGIAWLKKKFALSQQKECTQGMQVEKKRKQNAMRQSFQMYTKTCKSL